jgi:hypothetical protein
MVGRVANLEGEGDEWCRGGGGRGGAQSNR